MDPLFSGYRLKEFLCVFGQGNKMIYFICFQGLPPLGGFMHFKHFFPQTGHDAGRQILSDHDVHTRYKLCFVNNTKRGSVGFGIFFGIDPICRAQTAGIDFAEKNLAGDIELGTGKYIPDLIFSDLLTRFDL